MAIDGYYRQYIDTELTERWVSDTLTAVLLKPEYSPSLDTHASRGDIPANAIIAESVVPNRSVVAGRLLCDDITFANVAASSTQIASVVFINTTTDRLIAVLQNVSGLSVAPNGNDISLRFSSDTGAFAI